MRSFKNANQITSSSCLEPPNSFPRPWNKIPHLIAHLLKLAQALSATSWNTRNPSSLKAFSILLSLSLSAVLAPSDPSPPAQLPPLQGSLTWLHHVPIITIHIILFIYALVQITTCHHFVLVVILFSVSQLTAPRGPGRCLIARSFIPRCHHAMGQMNSPSTALQQGSRSPFLSASSPPPVHTAHSCR